MDFAQVLDHVCIKCPQRDEEALDAPCVLQASQEILKSEDFEACSKEFKDQLRCEQCSALIIVLNVFFFFKFHYLKF